MLITNSSQSSSSCLAACTVTSTSTRSEITSASIAQSNGTMVLIAVICSIVGACLVLLVAVAIFNYRRQKCIPSLERGEHRNAFQSTSSRAGGDGSGGLVPPNGHSRTLKSWIDRVDASRATTSRKASTAAPDYDGDTRRSDSFRIPRKPPPKFGGETASSSSTFESTSVHHGRRLFAGNPKLSLRIHDPEGFGPVGPSAYKYGRKRHVTEPIPIPGRRISFGSELEVPVREERLSSEYFTAVPSLSRAASDTSPAPSSLCLYDPSPDRLQFTIRDGTPPFRTTYLWSGQTPSDTAVSNQVKTGNINANLPFYYFPTSHEGHRSARGSIHSGSTQLIQQQDAMQPPRVRTRSLPLSQVRKATSAENVKNRWREHSHPPVSSASTGASNRRVARKEVPRDLLQELAQQGTSEGISDTEEPYGVVTTPTTGLSAAWKNRNLPLLPPETGQIPKSKSARPVSVDATRAIPPEN
ncbi:hypothetical protein CPB86DRAFT_799355 [Serendipita vermifera]|nr:hypothetical protein CPB86DRAFT_799355 [Serendipita vermifera]